MQFTVYKNETGEITSRYVRGSIEDVEDLIGFGEAIIEGWFDKNVFYIDQGAAVEKPPRPSETHDFDYQAKAWVNNEAEYLPDLKAAALARIDEMRGRARLKYITDLPGQDSMYMAKREEAVAYLADPDPDDNQYPLIKSEIGETSPDGYSVAQIFLNLNDLWREAAGAIDAACFAAKREVQDAIAANDIAPIVDALQMQLSA